MGAIADVYLKTRKVPDFVWNTYVARPPAAVIVWMIGKTRITPNQVTLAAFVVAAASIAMIALSTGYLGLVAGVFVFEFSYVLDCVDGMLARLRGTQSTVGHLFDFLMDEIKAFAMLGAVSIRLWRQEHDDRFLVLGIVGLVCLASGIALTTFQRRPEIAGPAPAASATASAPQSVVRRAIGLVERLARLLIHYPSYILLVALTGRIDFYFYPYIAVNALYALRAFTSVALRFGR